MRPSSVIKATLAARVSSRMLGQRARLDMKCVLHVDDVWKRSSCGGLPHFFSMFGLWLAGDIQKGAAVQRGTCICNASAMPALSMRGLWRH
jgi:hypothetical protein